MPVSGASADRATRVASFVFERASRIISNEIKRNEGVVAVLGAKKRIQMQDGGDLFRVRVEMAENSNVAFRAATAQVATAQQNNWRTVGYGMAHLTGASVLNEIEEDQNQSEFAISSMVEGMLDNLKHTFVRQVGTAFRNSGTIAATDPESLFSMLPATAPGSQTGTFPTGGGLSRADNTFWRSQFNSTAADLTTAAGINTLTQFYIGSLTLGSGATEQPDFGICDSIPYSSLLAFGTDRIRFNSDESVAKLGFPNVKYLNSTIIIDPNLGVTGQIFFLNTNYTWLKVLRSRGMQTVGDEPDTLPVTIKKWDDDIDSFNRVALARVTYNFCTSSLQRNGRKTGIT